MKCVARPQPKFVGVPLSPSRPLSRTEDAARSVIEQYLLTTVYIGSDFVIQWYLYSFLLFISV